MSQFKRCLAEFIGTFWLVFAGCGSAVLAATFTTDGANIAENIRFPLGIGFIGVSLAFGLSVLTMASALGHISGGHFNPAVSVGLWAAKRFPGSELPLYIGSQVFGAIVAAGFLYLIASGKPGFILSGANPLATNGFGPDHSPGGYSVFACFVAELVLSFMFLIVILGVSANAPQGFAPIAIGLVLTLIHLISIPITNTSVNPARSLGPALFVGGWAIQQLWLFWLAPIMGAFLAGTFYHQLLEVPKTQK